MSFLRAIVKAALFLTPYFYLLLIRTYEMNKTTLIVQSTVIWKSIRYS